MKEGRICSDCGSIDRSPEKKICNACQNLIINSISERIGRLKGGYSRDNIIVDDIKFYTEAICCEVCGDKSAIHHLSDEKKLWVVDCDTCGKTIVT